MVLPAPRTDDWVVRAADIAECTGQLGTFANRYRPLMTRAEQRDHLTVYLEGLIGGLERKTIEPIATAHGLYRRPLQLFVGAGGWSDRAIRDEMRTHVVEEIGDRSGVMDHRWQRFRKEWT